MKLKLKKTWIIIAILFLVASGILITVKQLTATEKIPVDFTEKYIDSIIEEFIGDTPYLKKKPLLGSKEIAEQYARIIYWENYGEWDEDFEIWVKHYKKHGVWFAWLRSSEPVLHGPPPIVFQDVDGKIIWYGN